MDLQSHNMRIAPEVTHYDNKGNKIKTMTYPPENVIGEDSNIELTLYEKDGTVKDVFILPFRSFSGNWATIFNSRVYQLANNVTFIDTGGTNRTTNSYSNLMSYTNWGAVNQSASGVVVGATGSTGIYTQSIDRVALGGQITHGTAVGQLTHAAVAIDSQVSEISGSYMFSISRTFTNNSAGSTNVKEVGIYFSAYSTQYKWMGCRDTKDSNGNDINVTVAPTQVLTVKYNIYIPRQSGLTKAVAAYLLSEINGGANIPTGSSQLVQDNYYEVATVPNNYGVYSHFMGAGAAIGWNGIVPGTGTATESAFAPGDLYNYITHGVEAGQLSYGSNEYDGLVKTYSTSGSAAEWNVKRTFTNAHANPTTVREAMIVCGADVGYANNTKWTTSTLKFIYARKLIGDQTIVSGSTLEINFKFMIET